MERVLEIVSVDGAYYRIGNIVRVRDIPDNKGEGIHGKYKIERIIENDGDIYFDLESIDGHEDINGRWHWRFEHYKKNNLKNY